MKKIGGKLYHKQGCYPKDEIKLEALRRRKQGYSTRISGGCLYVFHPEVERVMSQYEFK